MWKDKSVAYQGPHDLPPAIGGQVPAPLFGQSLDQHETAAAFVIEAGLVWFGRPGVPVPHLHERRLPVGGKPEMDKSQAVLIGVMRALVLVRRNLDGVGDKLGDNQLYRAGQIVQALLVRDVTGMKAGARCRCRQRARAASRSKARPYIAISSGLTRDTSAL